MLKRQIFLGALSLLIPAVFAHASTTVTVTPTVCKYDDNQGVVHDCLIGLTPNSQTLEPTIEFHLPLWLPSNSCGTIQLSYNISTNADASPSTRLDVQSNSLYGYNFDYRRESGSVRTLLTPGDTNKLAYSGPCTTAGQQALFNLTFVTHE